MKPSVYVETSVFGHLATRTSALLVTAANQQVTRESGTSTARFDLFVSLAVVDECTAGDVQAAAEREVFLKGIPVLGVDDHVLSLAQSLMTGIPLPEKAAVDAVHIAVATVNGVDYLVTWNCKLQTHRQSGIAWYN